MTLTYEREKVAVLYATFNRYGGPPIDPDSTPQITIYYEDTVIIPATNMTQISTGYWFYSLTILDTFDLGTYNAVFSGQIGGIPFEQIEAFNIVALGKLLVIPDVPTNAYCTNADVRAELAGVYLDDIPDIDDLIVDDIAIHQEEINSRCNNNFNSTRELIWLDGTGLATINLPHQPVTTLHNLVLRVVPSVMWYTFSNPAYINVLRRDGISVRTASIESEVTNADILVDCVMGQLIVPARILFALEIAYPFWNYTFVRGIKNIEVDYTWGYSLTTRPLSIRHLCSKMVAREILLKKSDLISGGMSSLSADGFSRGFGGIPYDVRLQRLESDIDELINRNRTIGLG